MSEAVQRPWTRLRALRGGKPGVVGADQPAAGQGAGASDDRVHAGRQDPLYAAGARRPDDDRAGGALASARGLGQ
jgi:hypothetical protein